MITIGALDQGASDSWVDPKWLIIKVMAWKGCSDHRPDVVMEHMNLVSHRLKSLLGAIELIILCCICMHAYSIIA